MRLRQLKISGFKSFADTTLIEFPGAVSGIVGPNGCGKSNLIDAIRWVLGEGRVSELRGSSSMSELIFSGSATRSPSARASVEIVLDNSDGTVQGAWGKYSEISVKRVVTRDGTNAYLLNNQQVRRRDVQDIFLGTGLGPRSYAIISQGMISNFIKARPEELRIFLEEAAGVSKYKERRKETETALGSTRANLEKVALLQENKRQEIERLTQEAQVAARWQSLDEQRRHLECVWLFLQETEAADAVNRLSERIAARELDIVTSQGQLRQSAAAIEQLKQTTASQRELLEQAHQAVWKAQSEVTEVQTSIRHIVQQRDSLTQRIAQDAEAEARHRAELEQISARQQGMDAQQQELLARAQSEQEEAEGLAEQLAQAEEHYEQSLTRYEQARAGASETENRIGIVNVEIEALVRESTQIEQRSHSLHAEMDGARAPDAQRLGQLHAQLEQAGEAMTEATQQIALWSGRTQQLAESVAQVTQHKNSLAQQLARVTAQIDTLRTIEEKLASEGHLPQWLRKMGLDTAARFYESLSLEPRTMMALEAILSVRATALPLTRLSIAAGFAQDAPPARLVFCERTAAQDGEADSAVAVRLPRLLEQVRVTDSTLTGVLQLWLRDVFIAADLAEALRWQAQLPPGARIVTEQGHVLDRVSISFWTEETESAGTLSRSVQIRELTEQQASWQDEAAQVSEQLVQLGLRLDDARVREKAQRALLQTLQQQYHTIELEHTQLDSSIQAWTRRHEQIQAELGTLEQRAQELAGRHEEAEIRFEQLDQALSTVQQAVTEAQVRLDEAEQAVAVLQDRERELKQSVRLARLRADEIQTRSADARQTQQRVQAELTIVLERVQTLQGALQALDESEQTQTLVQAREHLSDCQQREQQARTLSDTAENALECARTEHQQVMDRQGPLLQEISDLKVKRQAWSTQGQALTEQLDERRAERAALSRDVLENHFRTAAVKAQVTQLIEQISALGSVNHAALSNLQISQKTMDETHKQVEDLQKAIDNLESTIRRIDAETRELLGQTFATVNANFSEMFVGLFAGGSARLEMTGDEILESGVEVMAMPPGKRNTNIKVLSGGEQALTATALVFAIFRLNPAPFCLLDEVDAPLDEANQERLARQIVAMSGKTQFMMITHHRVTMEYLQQLVGVTMKEPGVSRVVSVDVAEASNMVGA